VAFTQNNRMASALRYNSPMSRLRRIEQRDRFFFVTTNLSRNVAALSPSERTLVLDILDTCRARMRFKLFAYMVMPDHDHFLLDPGTATLTSLMRDFKSKTGLRVNAHRATRGPLWQSRFFDFICRRVRDFSEKVEYIHRNPVEAGLVKRPEEWPWPSAGFCLQREQAILTPDKIDLPADGNTLLWPAPWR
jgi:REP-associated tyrosine transposase